MSTTLDRDKLARHYQEWRSLLTGVLPAKPEQAANALSKLAALSGRRVSVLRCRNPFELVIMPSLLFSCLSSRGWKRVEEGLAANDYTSSKGRQLWDKYWDSLWAQILMPVLDDLLADLPSPHSLKRCLPGVAQGLKGFLESQLKAETVSQISFENRFSGPWSMQMTRSNLASRKMLEQSKDLITQTFEARFLQQERCLTAPPLPDASLPQGLRASANSRLVLTAAITIRLGLEARKQLSSVVWLPAQILWLAEMLECDVAGVEPIFFGSRQEEESLASRHLRIWLELASTCSGFICTDTVAFVLDNPGVVAVNQNGVLHNETGPALDYCGEFPVYVWNGTLVPDFVVEDPAELSVDKINAERDLEVRRVMLERFGTGRYVLESGATMISQDQYGTLYRSDNWGREPLVVVRVRNSTPEANGSFREFFLRVPPHVQTAQEAVAWSFELEEQEYCPQKES